MRIRPIIILGAARSGTSLVADLVHRWGAYGGDPAELTAGNAANPRGYFEHRKMQQFMVRQLGVDFWIPDFPERLRQQARVPELRALALELVRDMEAPERAWFWKEPLLSIALPFWQEFWTDPIYLITLRNPYEVVVSFEKLSLVPAAAGRVSIIAAGLLRWQYFMLSILQGTEASRSRIFVPYSSLVESADEQCRRLCRFLDDHCGVDGRPDRFDRMIETIEPSLHHNRSEISLSEVPEATSEQKRLYDLLLRMVDDPELEFAAADYPLYEGWREYLSNLSVFAQFYSQVSSTLRSRPVQMAIDAVRWKDTVSRRLRSLGRAFRLPNLR